MRKLLFLLPFLFSQYTYAVVCPAGEVDSGGVCVSACSILQGESRTFTYDSYIWGDSPTAFCFGSRSGGAACRMNASGDVALNVPANSQYWSKQFTFNGGTCPFEEINRFSGDTPEPFPYEGDVNQNGINDDYEDWDGDGIDNGQDPDPYNNNSGVPDENKDGIPDDLAGVYDELAKTQEILYCNNNDGECQHMRSVMSDLTESNQVLAAAMRDASLKNVRRTDFNQSVGQLTKTVNSNDRQILNALNNLDFSNLDDSQQISEVKHFLNDRISGTAYATQDIGRENRTTLSRVENGVRSNGGQILTVGEKVDTVLELEVGIMDAIENIEISGGSGLTSTQKNQLRNAAKAKENGNKLNHIKQKVDDYGYAFDAFLNNQNEIINGVEAGNMLTLSISDDVNANTNNEFAKLSDQIAAISGGQSTIDLSGVESSIDALGEKIDGLENGSDSAPSGSCSNGFVCTGNTYDCYLAQQAFETKCALSNQGELLGDVLEGALGSNHGTDVIAAAHEDLVGALNGLGDELESGAIQGGDGKELYLDEEDISQYLDTYNQDNGGLNFNNDQCPRPIELNFVLASVKQMNMELSLEWLCELALYVRAMLMLGAAMISGRLWFQNF